MMANKGSAQHFFEDFELGSVITCPTPRVLTEGDRVAYIMFTGDRTPRYCNLKGLIHPLIVFHTVMGQTVRPISLNAVANLGYAEMMWKEPVYVGDEIHTTATIVGLKENRNRHSGIVYVKTVGSNQHDHVVLEYTRWVMVKKNRGDVTAYLNDPVIPNLADAVSREDLMHSPDPFQPDVTGGQFFFDDYSIGERIFHMDGTTLQPTEHMSFTRLYQNTARVHFDHLATEGKPLVFGGLPMSIGYAQAYNGFENRLGMVAINGGTHSNPVYAGDTIYSFTDVLDSFETKGAHGALRLRLVVVKNQRPTPGEDFQIKSLETESGKETYHKNVVLDLDFWELLARRQ